MFFQVVDDFAFGVHMAQQHLVGKIEDELKCLIGMEQAHQWFEETKKKVAFVEKTGDRAAMKMCMNLVITGNPGTGKTTFVRLCYEFMRAYGVLPSDHPIFVEKNGYLSTLFYHSHAASVMFHPHSPLLLTRLCFSTSCSEIMLNRVQFGT